jgi:FKBP-type peptidyl-prolyl cis-trans isomerase
MRAGERAAVYITDPSYGYGEKGSFSFPSVPPSCQLVYEVDMIAWEPPAEVGAVSM